MFGDGSLYVTYRNVCSLCSFQSFHSRLAPTASDPEHHWRPSGLFRRMGRQTSVLGTQRQPCNVLTGRRVSVLASNSCSPLNDLLRYKALTGVFFYASTTSRTSNQLLGWDCGYVFFSNVRFFSSFRAPPTSLADRVGVDDVWGSVRHLSRDLSRQGSWDGKRVDGHCDPRVWRDGACSLSRKGAALARRDITKYEGKTLGS